MNGKEVVIEKIHAAFQDLEFPGENFLQGSSKGAEPYEEVGPFQTWKEWTAVDAELLVFVNGRHVHHAVTRPAEGRVILSED